MGMVHRLTFTALSAVLALCLCSSAAFAICGDNVPDPGELCDDGNLTDGDGCDSNCTPTGCGNGRVTTGEECDDGNTVAGDGCSGNNTQPPCQVEPPPGCGDGVRSDTEECDDDNTDPCDGCSKICVVEKCGNGAKECAEVCDDGGTVLCATLGAPSGRRGVRTAKATLGSGRVTLKLMPRSGGALLAGRGLDLSALVDRDVRLGLRLGAQHFAGGGTFRARNATRWVYP